MDSDFRIDLSEVKRNLDAAEVVSLYFPLLRKTLLIDTRCSSVDGPLIKVVPMVTTPEERFRSLRQMRPRFSKPESITIIPWPKYVGSLARLGVWDHIVSRFADLGDPSLVRQCEACLKELLSAERQEIGRAIRGENFQDLWRRSEQGGEPQEGEGEGEKEDEGRSPSEG
jgi:hypothetical protein